MAEKKLMVVVGAKASEFNRIMGQVQKDTKSISKLFKDVGKDMQVLGKTLTASITVPIMAVGGAALKFYGDFEKQMAQSTAIMDDLSDDMRKKMEVTAREIGKTTRFGATQAAEAFEFLALAGLDAEQSIAALPQVAAFAQAGNFDLARATDLATDAQSALGMTSEDAAENLENLTRVTDVLTRAATLANANTEQFSEALTEKAGVALRNLNKDVEEGSAVLAVFADQGVKGGQAGIILNASLEGLSRQAIINKDIFAEYNVEVFDTEGNMKHMADITEDLEKALGEMSVEEQRATLMKMGFNRQALNGIQMLMGNSDAIREYEKELRSAGGVTQEVAEKQMNNLWDQLGLLKDRLIDSGIVLGEVLGDTIRDVVIPMIDRLVESIAKIAEWFANLDPFWQQFIITALAIAAVLGPVILIAGKIMSAIGALIPIIAKIIVVVKTVGAAVAGVVSGPLLLIVGAIAAAIAIGVLLYKNWDKIKEVLDRVWGAIVDFFTVTIPEAINTGLKWFSELPGRVAEFLNELPGKIGELLGKALGYIIKFGIDAMKWAIAEVPKFIANVIKFYMELPGKIWEWLLAALKKLGEWAMEGLRIVGGWGRDLLSWAKRELPGVVNNIVSFFKGLPGKFLEIGKDIVRGLWDGISSMVGWIRSKISDFVGGIVSGVKGVLGISSPSRIFMGIGENITTGLAKGISEAQAVVDSAMTRLFDPNISLNYASGSAGVSDTDATAQAVYRAMMDAFRMAEASSPDGTGDTRALEIKLDSTVLAQLLLPALVREGQRQGLNLFVRLQGV